jgi:hypothetical protein
LGSVRHEFLIFINQTGTASSSPDENTASQSNMNIANVIIWKRKEAYEDSTTSKVTKILRHLKRNCNTADPEEVKLAKDHNMPELKQICLNDFRRFKGSKTYHLTRDVLCVKELLGHKDTTLRSTLKRTSLFDERNITWIPVVCTTKEEIEQAIQDDYMLVCQADGKTYFKKPA